MCACREWKEKYPEIESRVTIALVHGDAFGLQLEFKFCPWCGRRLNDDRADDSK